MRVWRCGRFCPPDGSPCVRNEAFEAAGGWGVAPAPDVDRRLTVQHADRDGPQLRAAATATG